MLHILTSLHLAVCRRHVTVTKEDWDRKLSYSMTTSCQRMEALCEILTEVRARISIRNSDNQFSTECLEFLGLVSIFSVKFPRKNWWLMW